MRLIAGRSPRLSISQAAQDYAESAGRPFRVRAAYPIASSACRTARTRWVIPGEEIV